MDVPSLHKPRPDFGGPAVSAERQLDSAFVQREEILPFLNQPKKQGGWVMAFCPCHGDGSKHGGRDGRSLGLSDDGVLQCFAGCAFKDVMAALRGSGVSARPHANREPRRDDTGWVTVDVYEYRNAAGDLVAVKKREHRPNPQAKKGYDKRFAWRHPDHDYSEGLTKFGLTMEGMPLWGAESVLAAPEKRVWYVEGEEAVKAIQGRQEVAVCAGGGAGQKAFGEALSVLTGRKVILWPDNDPAGRDYMAHVRRCLPAKTILVNPPNIPSGDAVDWFAAGHTVEEVLAGVLTEPATDWLGDDSIAVRIPTDKGIVTFTFEAVLRTTRGVLEAEALVSHKIVGIEPEPYWQRINVLSPTTVEGFVRSLGAQFGKDVEPNWRTLTTIATGSLRRALGTLTKIELLAGDMDAGQARWFSRNFLLEGGGSILFGPPGKGKSNTALLVSVLLDAGITDGPIRIENAARVLYVDLERPAVVFRSRLARMNMALGLDPRRPLAYLNARGRGLVDVLPDIRQAIKEFGFEVVAIDSLSRMGYGDLTRNDVANEGIDALNSLGVAWLGIGHTPRNDDSHLYGGVHWDAGADVMVQLVSERGFQSQSELGVGLQTVKNNHGPIGEQHVISFRFDDGGLVAVERDSAERFTDIGDRQILNLPYKERVFEVLRKGAMTAQEIADATDMLRGSVAKLLRDERYFVKAGDRPAEGDRGGRPQALYGLRSSFDPAQNVAKPSAKPNPNLEKPLSTESVVQNPEIRITCSRCRRDGMALEGYGPDGGELCLTCYDDWKAEAG